MSSFKLKVLFVGAAGVGKEELIEKFIKNRFAPNYKLTVGVDILTKDVEFRPGEIATLSIWVIGGQQRFEFIRNTFYKDTEGIIAIFDVMREQTYAEICRWLTEIRQVAGDNIPFLLIGNTANLTETNIPAINSNEVREFADKEGGIYLESSPDMTEVIDAAISELTRRIISPVKRTLEEDFLDSPEKFKALISFYGVLLRKLKEEASGIEILHLIETLDPELYKMMRVEENPKILPWMAKYMIETLKRRTLKAGTKPLKIFINKKKTRYKIRYKWMIGYLERLRKYAIKTRRECRAEFFRSKSLRSIKRLKESKKSEEGRKEEEKISRHEVAKTKETESKLKEEDRIYLKRIISGEDVFMSIPEGKDITKPEASHYDILFVEGLGYPDTITLPMKYFESKGYSCQGVCGGKKGFDELYINIPKVILLDIILPDFSGYEICKQIKSNPKWKDIPVFFFTTIPGSEIERHMKETGADGYILKPFSFSDFDGILDLLKNKRIK